MLNPAKNRVSLNLKEPRGRAILMRMLATADVMVENFAPGALDRLGPRLSMNCASRFPRLVYASSKGYGADSRLAQLGAMDFTVQAASGIISMTGYATDRVCALTAALIDTSTGMHLAAGITAALFERQRTGRGRKVDVAMLDVTVPAIAAISAAARTAYHTASRQSPSERLPLEHLSRRNDGEISFTASPKITGNGSRA